MRNWDRPPVILRSSGGTPRGFPVDCPGLISNIEKDRARSMTQDRPGNSPDSGVRTLLRIILEIKRGSLEDCSADGLPDQMENQSEPWSLGGLEMGGQ